MRLDSLTAGDAFWTPDGVWDTGAAGFQGNNNFRLVNGASSNVTAQQGQTYFVVQRVSEISTSLWVNPNLKNSGVALATLIGLAPRDSNELIFKFNNVNSGAYTVDEIRIGSSFADVAPFIDFSYPTYCQRRLHQWQPEPKKIDFMVIAAHPGDESIFFGGALPYYAKVRNKKSFLVGMTGRSDFERAAWHNGVRYAPVNMDYPDVNGNIVEEWDPQNGLSGIARRIAGLLRRYKPDVIITNELNGEYGHEAHRVTAEAVVLAYDLAANSTLNIDGLPAWTVPKLYLHLYQSPRGTDRVPEPQVTHQGFLYHSWEGQYAELNNKTPHATANDALQCYQDAVKRWGNKFLVVSREVVGEWFDDNMSEDWGLYKTSVGQDTVAGDFFQNIVSGSGGDEAAVVESIPEATLPATETPTRPEATATTSTTTTTTSTTTTETPPLATVATTTSPLVTETSSPPQVETPAATETSAALPAPSFSVYEPFGGDVLGFESGSSWYSNEAVGTFEYVEGLSYQDADGNTLTTQGQALSANTAGGGPYFNLRRALATTLTASTGNYWASYLIRLDSANAGDAFWSPDDRWHIGAAGFQGSTTLRLVNGGASSVTGVQGTTYLLVVEISASSASLWVNPNLSSPGSAHATRNEAAKDSSLAVFGFNNANGGSYTVDELRIGASFADVTPFTRVAAAVGPSAQPQLDQELITPVADAPTTTMVPPASIYEPFGGELVGFESGSAWYSKEAVGVLGYVEGLKYQDANGNALVTQGHALSVNTVGGGPFFNLRRALTASLTVSTGSYWVSYLIRLDSSNAGDAFWTPDGLWDIGGAGFQGSTTMRLVNGGATTVTGVQGATYLLVVEVGLSVSSLWVNPDLKTPGSALATRNDAAKDSVEAIFKFNNANSGSYTVDELRIGSSFASVTPHS